VGDFAPVCAQAPGAKVRQASTGKKKTGNLIFAIMLLLRCPESGVALLPVS
jgi:hypothetical protein